MRETGCSRILPLGPGPSWRWSPRRRSPWHRGVRIGDVRAHVAELPAAIRHVLDRPDEDAPVGPSQTVRFDFFFLLPAAYLRAQALLKIKAWQIPPLRLHLQMSQ